MGQSCAGASSADVPSNHRRRTLSRRRLQRMENSDNWETIVVHVPPPPSPSVPENASIRRSTPVATTVDAANVAAPTTAPLHVHIAPTTVLGSVDEPSTEDPQQAPLPNFRTASQSGDGSVEEESAVTSVDNPLALRPQDPQGDLHGSSNSLSTGPTDEVSTTAVLNFRDDDRVLDAPAAAMHVVSSLLPAPSFTAGSELTGTGTTDMNDSDFTTLTPDFTDIPHGGEPSSLEASMLPKEPSDGTRRKRSLQIAAQWIDSQLPSSPAVRQRDGQPESEGFSQQNSMASDRTSSRTASGFDFIGDRGFAAPTNVERWLVDLPSFNGMEETS